MIRPLILIPDYKIEKTLEEQKCLDSLKHLKSSVDYKFILPESLLGKEQDNTIYFPDKYFKSIITYSQLIYSSFFWDQFLDYTHALIFQPDCFLFGDRKELEFWCKMGYFMVGPSHFKDYDFNKNPGELQSTMNGGFSLRNIKAHYNICKALEEQGFNHKECQAHEDTFWVQMAQKFGMRLPDPLTAIRFGFEQGGSALYELIGRQKPFGVHAPYKYQDQYGETLFKEWFN